MSDDIIIVKYADCHNYKELNNRLGLKIYDKNNNIDNGIFSQNCSVIHAKSIDSVFFIFTNGEMTYIKFLALNNISKKLKLDKNFSFQKERYAVSGCRTYSSCIAYIYSRTTKLGKLILSL